MTFTLFRKANKAKRLPCSHQQAAQTPNSTAIDSPQILSDSASTTGSIIESSKCAECKEERKKARKYRWQIILSLTLPFALQALDATLIAAALPWIALDFGEVPQLNWIVSAFNLTSAAFIPFWGQMADIFGRHSSLQACILCMMVGSAICTGAPLNAFPLLLFGRAFQGVGAAGLGIVVRTIIADKVSLKENSTTMSIFSMISGIAYGIAPWLGGVLTNINWRWNFAINLPICFISIPIVFFFLRKELLGPQPLPELDETNESGRISTFALRVRTIDIGGQLLCILGCGLLILACTWGGSVYGWHTAAVLVPLVFGTIIAAGFFVWEYLFSPGKAVERWLPFQRPMIPWHLLVNRNIVLLWYINLATGMAMYSVFYFVSIYYVMVEGLEPQKAGVQLLFYIPGLGAGVYISMFMCNVYPKKTFYPLSVGSIVELVGLAMLTVALRLRRDSLIFGMMALSGAGSGLRFMPGTLHALGFFRNKIATVVALMALAMPFGGTFGLTIMTTVFNNKGGIGINADSRDFKSINELPEGIRDIVKSRIASSIVWAFVSILPFMVIGVIAALFLGNVNITDEATESDQDGNENVTHGPYIFEIFRKPFTRTPTMEFIGHM